MTVIAVCNQKGGSGKTTMAINLAGAFAAEDKRVLLLDLDPQGSALDWGSINPDTMPQVEVAEIDRPQLLRQAKVLVAPTDCLCSADMYPLRPRNSLQRDYLFWLLLSTGFTAWSVLQSDRVAMPKINRQTLNNVHIPLPPLSEQVSIVRHLIEATAKASGAIDRARRQIELMEEYRTRLIADVVTGKIDVREAKP